MIKEQRQLIEQLDGIHCHYGNFHGINLLTEIDGVFPEDETKIVSIIENFLCLSSSLQHNFILGRRMGYYGLLAGFQESPRFNVVQQQLEKIQGENPESLEAFFHDMRNCII